LWSKLSVPAPHRRLLSPTHLAAVYPAGVSGRACRFAMGCLRSHRSLISGPVVVRQAAKVAEPARRVLPAILPMFVLSEAEPRDEPAESDAPPARPLRTKGERKRRVPAVKRTAESVPVMPAIGMNDTIDPDLPEPIPSTATHPQQPRSNRRERSSSRPELRRGEGWKRRLPRVCW